MAAYNLVEKMELSEKWNDSRVKSLQENIDKLQKQNEIERNAVEKAENLNAKIKYHEDLLKEMRSSADNLTAETMKGLEFRIETRQVLIDQLILQTKFLQERTDDILVSKA